MSAAVGGSLQNCVVTLFCDSFFWMLGLKKAHIKMAIEAALSPCSSTRCPEYCVSIAVAQLYASAVVGLSTSFMGAPAVVVRLPASTLSLMIGEVDMTSGQGQPRVC